jgi:hypothetical protein
MRRLLASIASVLLFAAVLTGCGTDPIPAGGPSIASAADCPTSNTTAFARTKFAGHVGLAAGSFHHWIWKPFKAGSLQKGAHHRVIAIAKAVATAAFVQHEIKQAIQDVKASPGLCKAVITPLSELQNAFGNLASTLGTGNFASLAGINASVASLLAVADRNGAQITETST